MLLSVHICQTQKVLFKVGGTKVAQFLVEEKNPHPFSPREYGHHPHGTIVVMYLPSDDSVKYYYLSWYPLMASVCSSVLQWYLSSSATATAPIAT